MSRAAFTLIELISVMAVIAILAAMVMPATLRISQKAALANAAESLIRVHRAARQLAMAADPAPGTTGKYGVALIATPGAPAYVTIVFGDGADDELMADDDGDGNPDSGPSARPLMRAAFGDSLEIMTDRGTGTPTPLNGSLVWFCDWRTGGTLSSASSAITVSVGTPGRAAKPAQTFASPYGTNDVLSLALPAVAASPVCTYLGLRHRGGRMSVALAIYAIGIAHRSDG